MVFGRRTNAICYTTVVISFLFQVFSVSMANLKTSDVTINSNGFEISFFRRKGNSARHPLILQYPTSCSWDQVNRILLFSKWLRTVQLSTSTFHLSLSDTIQQALTLTAIESCFRLFCSQSQNSRLQRTEIVEFLKSIHNESYGLQRRLSMFVTTSESSPLTIQAGSLLISMINSNTCLFGT